MVKHLQSDKWGPPRFIKGPAGRQTYSSSRSVSSWCVQSLGGDDLFSIVRFVIVRLKRHTSLPRLAVTRALALFTFAKRRSALPPYLYRLVSGLVAQPLRDWTSFSS